MLSLVGIVLLLLLLWVDVVGGGTPRSGTPPSGDPVERAHQRLFDFMFYP